MTFAVALIVFLADRFTKIFVIDTFFLGKSIPVIGGIFHITLVLNNGIAFGLLKNRNLIISVFSALAAAFIIYYVIRNKLSRGMIPFLLGLVLGGALGNLYDRVRFGYIIDFLDFRIWPVFNIADSAITAGVLVLAVYLLRSNHAKR